MIKVCLADNHPVVQFGVKSYFKDNADISLVGVVSNLDDLDEILKKKSMDVIVLDLELEGLSSINVVKSLIRDYSDTKIVVFTNLGEQIYAPNALKAGVSAYIHKNSKLEDLESAIKKVNDGAVIFSDAVKKNLALLNKGKKSDRLYRKLSSREIEVLRYLSDGKKNKEIAKLLTLNEKTISTYKLRLLTKLHVTNLVDLVNKAKTLEIV
ncbi:two-component system response regulatory protein [Flavobacterium saliperosum S13]|jgi:DNA-binding NarL/FixJ family response regulator|uniref:DNA-binding NarL/FixJ family response regulator n=3 Tax=Flavobacterium TaxID=237 RepID=V6S1A8_9FLAO|nr:MULTISPECIES: response regulator transcription factor [Flavobacterium]ESU20154.1 two-component system response regulatory protein [Flavobacterium cauense R2A-7]ESU27885.1 two-component system response regulatory protein [Flavobacterium saliperosum S13]KGO83954.1 LuxR family transcriptional regulator [Flavobacterium cauense R2A-7]TWI14704.1 DNA-binding NarL/FixJ family response regulator [Flavobacterium cauense R2A-7]SCX01723.1 DNA-binding response regulator, NarL/FixJ family, contains REC a